MQNFRFIVYIIYLFLYGCGQHYNVLSGVSKTGIKGQIIYVSMHYPGRKPVYLQIFESIGARVSEFRLSVKNKYSIGQS